MEEKLPHIDKILHITLLSDGTRSSTSPSLAKATTFASSKYEIRAIISRNSTFLPTKATVTSVALFVPKSRPLTSFYWRTLRRPIIVTLGEALLDILLGLEALHELDNLEIGHIDLWVLPHLEDFVPKKKNGENGWLL
jgi:hypothetical protein